jgi:hypothetical protein
MNPPANEQNKASGITRLIAVNNSILKLSTGRRAKKKYLDIHFAPVTAEAEPR